MKTVDMGKVFWPVRGDGSTPIWVAAHSPISRYDREKTLRLYRKYEDLGAALIVTGEIVLDCLEETLTGPVIRMKGCRTERGNPFGFFVLGPAEPNLIPIAVGIDLCEAAVKALHLPVVANIGCFASSTTDKVADNLKRLLDTGISAFEIALSCPNLEQQKNRETWWEENFRFLETIRRHSVLPISLKMGYQNLKSIELEKLFKFCNIYGVTQVAAIDGIKLICPPSIEDGVISPPFPDYPALCHTGAHGPWNRFLLYDSIATLKAARDRFATLPMVISAVGGIFSAKHAFEAMALGADNIQLSSVLFWKGIEKAGEIVADVRSGFERFNEALDGVSLDVDTNASDGFERLFGHSYVDAWPGRRMVSATDHDKCSHCHLCCNTPCLARTYEEQPLVDDHLCSGCGWCREICPTKAIYMRSL
jgi:dihydroorotate dehydrogenase/Pyruvate/2-oxoacid:ferredoxin oxidoreductase delta subunit